jgi:hypothetical protein
MAIFKVNTRSPIYIRVQNATIADAQLDLFIYTGTFSTDKPATATYSLTKSAISSNNYVIFEVSDLINDYINYTLSSASNINTSQTTVWAEATITPENALGVDLDVVSVIMLAFVGYGYYNEGFTSQTKTNSLTTVNVNAVVGNTNFLQSNTTIFRKAGDTVTIPLLSNYSVNSGSDTLTGSQTAVFKNGSSTISTVSASTGQTASSNAITYATSTTATLTSVDVTDSSGTTTITIEEQDCNKFNPIPVSFANKHGAIQTVNFFLKSIESLSVKNEEYNSNTLTTSATYNTFEHQYKVRNVIGREKIILNTGYVNDDFNQVIEELLLTERCWMTKDSTIHPLIPITKDVTFRTSLNDRLANYTIEFNYAYDKINLVS